MRRAHYSCRILFVIRIYDYFLKKSKKVVQFIRTLPPSYYRIFRSVLSKALYRPELIEKERLEIRQKILFELRVTLLLCTVVRHVGLRVMWWEEGVPLCTLSSNSSYIFAYSFRSIFFDGRINTFYNFSVAIYFDNTRFGNFDTSQCFRLRFR